MSSIPTAQVTNSGVRINIAGLKEINDRLATLENRKLKGQELRTLQYQNRLGTISRHGRDQLDIHYDTVGEIRTLEERKIKILAEFAAQQDAALKKP